MIKTLPAGRGKDMCPRASAAYIVILLRHLVNNDKYSMMILLDAYFWTQQQQLHGGLLCWAYWGLQGQQHPQHGSWCMSASHNSSCCVLEAVGRHLTSLPVQYTFLSSSQYRKYAKCQYKRKLRLGLCGAVLDPTTSGSELLSGSASCSESEPVSRPS